MGNDAGYPEYGQQQRYGNGDPTRLGTSYWQALVNIRVAFEAYPQLRTTETYQKAMASMEEGYKRDQDGSR